MTDKHKLMAYLLNKEMGYSMTDIAKLMKVAQSTISNSIKEIEFRKKISNLEYQLQETKKELLALGYNTPMVLPFNNDLNYNDN